MITSEMSIRIEQLVTQRQQFVLATVVRAQRPTSVRPGDTAIVLSDGTIEGFVGGVCAASSVRLHSLAGLQTGEPVLLRLIPEGIEGEAEPTEPGDAIDGAVVERNPCLSGGSLEIFLEPRLPAARLAIVGDSPIAHALERLGRAAGYDCRLAAAGDTDAVRGATALVVASHGSGEESVLATALNAGVPYVALVASAKRGAAVLAELEIEDQLRSAVHTPAGLEIGARAPEEIAIAILAELVAHQHSHPAPEWAGGTAAAETEAETAAALTATSAVTVAVDPVCGMRVAVTGVTPQLLVAGEPAYFCGEGCRDSYAREHSDATVPG